MKTNNHNRVGSTSFLRNRLSTKRCQSFMTESDEGELLAVFNGQWLQVCKLDESRMIWVPVHDLGNNSIFISNPATFVETTKIKGTENKIYVPWFRGTNVNNKKIPLIWCFCFLFIFVRINKTCF